MFMKKIREEWRVKQVIEDTEHQMAGDVVDDDVKAHVQPRLRGPQKDLVDALTVPPLENSTNDKHREQRDNAIQAVVNYCPVKVVCTVRSYTRWVNPVLKPPLLIDVDMSPDIEKAR